jgi:membrane-bound lytic murein transglycosylase D
MRRTTFATLAVILVLSFLFQGNAEAQIFRNKLRKENQALKTRVDSLREALDKLKSDKVLKDSIADEMIGVYEENKFRTAAGLNPQDYTPEITDSLLSIWYLHRQASSSEEGNGYDMDTIRFSSNVPDDVMKARLEKMNSFITLPYNDKVRNYMILYSEKMPTKMGSILGLCQYYMPIFEETFSKYKLPDELKYMAVIESALNPVAVSRAGAKGMWQFMFRTAKLYGLEINSYVDERLDPFKSADAAARYLIDSYNVFGDWNLAISSYNCGPGNINKAIRRNGSKRDFWSVYDYLPRETRGYVPAFVGAMYAIRYSKEYGLSPAPIQLPAQLDTFEIRRNLHFKQISELVGISVDELRNLNPQYIQDVIPGNSKTYILRIPYNYSSDFIAHEDSIYTYKAAEYLNPQTLVSTVKSGESYSGGNIIYKVKKGDTLGKIAAKYHVTVNQLKNWNHLRSTTISIGQKIRIYKGNAQAASSSVSQKSTTSSDKGSFITYTVKAGDSLYSIAKEHPNTTVDKIMKFNGITSSIKPGMTIKIPQE